MVIIRFGQGEHQRSGSCLGDEVERNAPKREAARHDHQNNNPLLGNCGLSPRRAWSRDFYISHSKVGYGGAGSRGYYTATFAYHPETFFIYLPYFHNEKLVISSLPPLR